MCSCPWRIGVGRDDWDADLAVVVELGIWIDIWEVGEVDSGGVLDGFQATAGVEVSDGRRSILRLYRRSLGLLDGCAEGPGVGELVGIEAGHELGTMLGGSWRDYDMVHIHLAGSL